MRLGVRVSVGVLVTEATPFCSACASAGCWSASASAPRYRVRVGESVRVGVRVMVGDVVIEGVRVDGRRAGDRRRRAFGERRASAVLVAVSVGSAVAVGLAVGVGVGTVLVAVATGVARRRGRRRHARRRVAVAGGVGVGVGDGWPVDVAVGLPTGGVGVGVGVGTTIQPDSAPFTARIELVQRNDAVAVVVERGARLERELSRAIDTPRTSSLIATMPSPLQSPTHGSRPAGAGRRRAETRRRAAARQRQHRRPSRHAAEPRALSSVARPHGRDRSPHLTTS